MVLLYSSNYQTFVTPNKADTVHYKQITI